MLLLATVAIVAGLMLLAYAAGRITQYLQDRKTIMASQNLVTLSAAVDDLLAANATQASKIADLEAQLAAPNPATQALADEETAEDALTAKIRAVVPTPAV